MTIAAILALAVVAFAASAYAYLVYSPKPQMPSLSTEVQHATIAYFDTLLREQGRSATRVEVGADCEKRAMAHAHLVIDRSLRSDGVLVNR